MKNQVHSFVVGDRFVSSNEQVCEVLKLLIIHLKDAGYVLDLDCFVHDLEDET